MGKKKNITVKFKNSELMLQYYTYYQNNTGGEYVCDMNSGLSPFVIIQAPSSYQANKIAQEKGIYFDGLSKGIDCNCCGNRWHPAQENNAISNIKEIHEIIIERTQLNRETSENNPTTAIFLHEYDGKIINLSTYGELITNIMKN